MANLPTSCTKSSTRGFRLRDYSAPNHHPKIMFFRGHRWKLEVMCPCDDDNDGDSVVFRMTGISLHNSRKHADTWFNAKFSIEILDESSGKPVVFENPLVRSDQRFIYYTMLPFCGLGRPVDKLFLAREHTISVKRRELEVLSCVQNKNFTFRWTVSEDVPPGIFYRLMLRVAGIFSKPTRMGMKPE
jgi:hypothetical protein